jgi:hypothetical protein
MTDTRAMVTVPTMIGTGTVLAVHIEPTTIVAHGNGPTVRAIVLLRLDRNYGGMVGGIVTADEVRTEYVVAYWNGDPDAWNNGRYYGDQPDDIAAAFTHYARRVTDAILDTGDDTTSR